MTTSTAAPAPHTIDTGSVDHRAGSGPLGGSTARAAWVDVVRVLAIWAVLMGHFQGADGRLRMFVFGFHVPLFFLVSGFFATRAADKPWWTAMKRRFRGIVVPFVVWSVIAVMVLSLTRTTVSAGEIQTMTVLQFQGRRIAMPAGAMWFLPALFVLQTAYDLLLRGLRLLRIPGAVWILAVAGLAYHIGFDALIPPVPFWPWSSDSSIYYFVFYALGAAVFPYLRRWLDRVEVSPGYRRVFVGLTAVAFVGAALTYIASLKIYDVLHADAVPYGGPVVSLVRTLALCFAVIVLAFWLRHSTMLAAIGRDTLLICCTETIMKTVIEHLFGIAGWPFAVNTPLASIIMATILVAIAHFVIAKHVRRHVPILAGS